MATRDKNTSATNILFDSLYKGRPKRIAALLKTRKELALSREHHQLRKSRKLSKHALAKSRDD